MFVFYSMSESSLTWMLDVRRWMFIFYSVTFHYRPASKGVSFHLGMGPISQRYLHAETGASLGSISCGYGTIVRLYNLQGIG